MEILNILTIINANTKFNKKSKIEDVKQQLLILENLLNLKWPYQLQGLSTEELDKKIDYLTNKIIILIIV